MAKIQKPFAVKGFNITSPKGKALWCKYKEADTKYNAKGEYSTSLVCDPNDPAVQKYIELLEELRDIAYNETCETLGAAKAKGVTRAEVYSEEFDSNGNETGNIIFKVKLIGQVVMIIQNYEIQAKPLSRLSDPGDVPSPVRMMGVDVEVPHIFKGIIIHVHSRPSARLSSV